MSTASEVVVLAQKWALPLSLDRGQRYHGFCGTCRLAATARSVQI